MVFWNSIAANYYVAFDLSLQYETYKQILMVIDHLFMLKFVTYNKEVTL